MFIGFDEKDFAVFQTEGLDERMNAIQQQIQPKFRELGNILSADLALTLGNEMFLHIAKHARRTVNPPKDTWLAISDNKRGYKKHPHFQVGLFDDHVFVWFALIYELPHKTDIANLYIRNFDKVNEVISPSFMISQDHMKKDAVMRKDLTDEEFMKMLERFRDVKKAELLIGKHIQANDPLLQDGTKLIQFIKETYETLLPLYKGDFAV